MSRTLLSPERRSETKKTNIGKVIIFCEGKTEKFTSTILPKLLSKTNILMWRSLLKAQMVTPERC